MLAVLLRADNAPIHWAAAASGQRQPAQPLDCPVAPLLLRYCPLAPLVPRITARGHGAVMSRSVVPQRYRRGTNDRAPSARSGAHAECNAHRVRVRLTLRTLRTLRSRHTLRSRRSRRSRHTLHSRRIRQYLYLPSPWTRWLSPRDRPAARQRQGA